MNISTYEARIKALEDQLNPPGPGPETGLVSVVVTPDITLIDNNSLNSVIAPNLPMASGEKLVQGSAQEFTTLAYTVTITPGSLWKAFFTSDGSDAGSVGEAISTVVHVSENNTLTFNAYASSDPLNPDAPYAKLRVQISKRV